VYNRLTHPVLSAAWLLLLALCSVQALAQPREPYDLPDDVVVTHIVLKFHEGSGMRLGAAGLVREQRASLPPGIAEADLHADAKSVEALAKANALTVTRAFRSVSELELDDLRTRGEAKSGERLPDLNLYFQIDLPAGSTFGWVKHLLQQLKTLKSLEVVYAAPRGEPASHLATPDLVGAQGYLDDAPKGIGARYAWTLPGGRGAGVRIVDVEYDWRVTHEDFPSLFHRGGTFYNDVFPPDLNFRNHGTAVVGVIGAKNNGYGVTGIVTDALVGVQSALVGTAQRSHEAIATAAIAVGAGGVVLIEIHRPGPADSTACTCNLDQCNYLPVEYWQLDFDVIKTKTANGVIVVEAGGNGSVNLDDSVYGRLFDRTIRDSGAILVGASLSTSRTPTCWTNFGSRVDAHGWGEGVATLGYGHFFNGGHNEEDRFYTHVFSGTSSASPIVVGAVASIQGNRRAFGLPPLTGPQMRSLLTSTGTPQSFDLLRRIGPMPDLRKVLLPPQSTSISLSASSSQIEQNETVTLTATVSGLNPTGTVSFYDNGVLIGTATLVNGVATFTTLPLNFGIHSFTVTYNGNGANLSSSSTAPTVVMSGNVSAIISIINSILLDD